MRVGLQKGIEQCFTEYGEGEMLKTLREKIAAMGKEAIYCAEHAVNAEEAIYHRAETETFDKILRLMDSI